MDIRNPVENYGAENWRAPKLEEGDALIFDEPGRVYKMGEHTQVTYQSHYFRVVRGEYGGYFILVKHGGGEERHHLEHHENIISALKKLDSDELYFTLYTIYRYGIEAERKAQKETRAQYQKAFVEGRLKKRKVRGQASIKVWIEPKIVTMQKAA